MSCDLSDRRNRNFIDWIVLTSESAGLYSLYFFLTISLLLLNVTFLSGSDNADSEVLYAIARFTARAPHRTWHFHTHPALPALYRLLSVRSVSLPSLVLATTCGTR